MSEDLYRMLRSQWRDRILKEHSHIDRLPELNRVEDLLEFIYQCYKQVVLYADPVHDKELQTVSVKLSLSTIVKSLPIDPLGLVPSTYSDARISMSEPVSVDWTVDIDNPKHFQDLALALLSPKQREIFFLLEDSWMHKISMHRMKKQDRLTTEKRSKQNKYVESSITKLERARLCQWCGYDIPNQRLRSRYDTDDCMNESMYFFKDMTKKRDGRFIYPSSGDSTLQQSVFHRLWKTQLRRREEKDQQPPSVLL